MRVNLKRVCLLIDTKWGMKPRDRELIDLMERYINHEPSLIFFLPFLSIWLHASICNIHMARTERSCSVMYRYQTKYQVVMTKTDLVFPIDVARRAMQIEEVNSAHKHRWQFCLKFGTLLRLTSVYLFNCAEPQGKQVSCSACGMTNFFYWTD